MKPIKLVALILITGCGAANDTIDVDNTLEGACADSPVVGTWNFGADIIGFGADCTFFSQLCATKGTYLPVTENAGMLQLTYTHSLGLAQNCYPVGYSQVCTYLRTPQFLDLDCPGME